MKLLGDRGEDLAVSFLKKKGLRIVERNFKTRLGEIDIIARDGDVVVFVEVKTRADNTFGRPFEAVDSRKRDKLRRVALLYLKHIKREAPSRFDVLSIEIGEGREKVEHIIDAFE